MGILIFTLVASLLGGSLTWLLIGDKFPLDDDIKLPAATHVLIYSGTLVIPVFLVVFFGLG